MNPIKFPESNFTFTKPEDMTDEQCSSLAVCKATDSEGKPVIISCWQLTPEDMVKIQETGVVWLTIVGHGMPPVSVHSNSPFIHNPNKIHT